MNNKITMDRLLFSDKHGVYKLMDYDQSHSQLLIRKHKHEDGGRNTDILFKGVYSMNIPILFKGIDIYAVIRSIDQTVSNSANRSFVFKLIDSLECVSYIDASAFGVFENTLNFAETSLGDFLWTPENSSKLWVTEKDFSPI
jgi:hypothetical protein